MVVSSYTECRKFKSPQYVVSAFLLRSRETQRSGFQQAKQESKLLAAQLQQCSRQVEQQRQTINKLKQHCLELKKELDEAKQSVNLPEDPPVGTHGYGTRMISLATNIAKAVGFRATTCVLELFFEWLKLDQQSPTHPTIRSWLQRLGIAELKQPLEPGEDLVIMVDHSNQIGKEKVLVALGVKSSLLPKSGKTLKHEDVRVLEMKPGEQWNTEKMEQEYQSLAKRFGTLRAVISDGATELRKGAEVLKYKGIPTLVLPDLKHYAANVMKSLIGKDPRFQEVLSQIGTTRSAIQQTELAHLRPPCMKQKARFMNLASTIKWMSMIAWLLENPDAKARAEISDERMQEKLGWVKQYADDIAVWQECQEVVSASLKFINEQYLFRGAAHELTSVIGDSLQYEKSKEVAKRLIEKIRDCEQHLEPDERLPMSTEILESLFGLYKQLERQHSQSGFTSLLACLPTLLKPTTPESVKQAFSRVSAKEVTEWIKANFSSTVTSQRQAAYQEHKSALKSATVQLATT